MAHPHGLGRKPSPPDPRDWSLKPFLGSNVELVTAAVLELKQTTRGYKDARYSGDPIAGSHWAKALAYLAQIAPPPPTGDVVWADKRQLDQGDTGHCVGFGWTQWGNTAPVEDAFDNAYAHSLYYSIKVIEGEPNQEDGAYVRDGATAMRNRGKLGAYAFAHSVSEITAYVRAHGPVVVGTDWYNDMFDPDVQGYVKQGGGIAGGHCYTIRGHLPAESAYLCQNSWGDSWGLGGSFKIKVSDFASLLAADGEAVAGLELP
jgi:hypothetical protein